ncbi:MAG: hypothetical protein M3Q44_05515 [bacterium]|nr:hypothetical protein [bacterium]
MSITQLLTELKELNLPQGHYAITASDPLAIRGLREARDLDIIVTEELWEELKTQYAPYLLSEDNIIYGNIHILGKYLKANDEIYATAEEQLAESELIGNLPFVKLETIKKYKTLLARDKDLEDLVLIQNYFNSIDTQ